MQGLKEAGLGAKMSNLKIFRRLYADDGVMISNRMESLYSTGIYVSDELSPYE